MANKEVVQRHEIADFLNVGTADAPAFELMGVGFTKLGETPNAQTSTKKYINEKASSTSVNGYQPKFDFEADQIKNDKVVQFIYEIGRNEKTGADCSTQYVRVELWNPVEAKENTYTARQFDVAVVVSGMDGDTDQVVSGSLNAQGNFVDGTFNTKTKLFEPKEALG